MSDCTRIGGLSSIFNNSSLFNIAIGIRIPVFEADRNELKKSRRMVDQYIRRIERVDEREIEVFLESITDMVSRRVTDYQAVDLKLKLNGLGHLAEVIEAASKTYESLDSGTKARFVRESISVTLDRIIGIERALGERMFTMDNSEELTSTYIIQSIVCAMISSLKSAILSLDADSSDESKAEDHLRYAFFGLLRIEAFLRGKIDLEDLHDTLTILLQSSSASVQLTISDVPDYVGEEG
jgi:hypothetical protein